MIKRYLKFLQLECDGEKRGEDGNRVGTNDG